MLRRRALFALAASCYRVTRSDDRKGSAIIRLLSQGTFVEPNMRQPGPAGRIALMKKKRGPIRLESTSPFVPREKNRAGRGRLAFFQTANGERKTRQEAVFASSFNGRHNVIVRLRCQQKGAQLFPPANASSRPPRLIVATANRAAFHPGQGEHEY